MSRAKLSRLMDAETWMDATKAVELGFADDIITKNAFPEKEKPDEDEESEEDESTEEDEKKTSNSVLFSRKTVNNALINKLEKHYKKPSVDVIKQAEIPAETKSDGVSAKEIRDRLDVIKKFI